jgi:hypothetical protein
MTVKKHSANTIDLKALMAEDKDFMKSLMRLCAGPQYARRDIQSPSRLRSQRNS